VQQLARPIIERDAWKALIAFFRVAVGRCWIGRVDRPADGLREAEPA
ncbi:MAG: hypothetical protein JO318_02600, partial [Chloroflexi bacterium]|nr:hypothetical protein [Chloroflexota bacterium]